MNEFQSTKDKDNTINFEGIQIELNKTKYDLNIKVKKDKIVFYIYAQEEFPSVNYKKAMNLKEIKDLNIVFSDMNSYNDFFNYLKSLSNNKKLNLKKK